MVSGSQAPVLLYVEDEFLIAMALEADLTETGYEVVSFASGTRAIEWLETGGAPDAVLTDVRLPGQNGWDVARAARKFFPDIPVVYLSGDSAGEWGRQGVSDSVMFAKPVKLSALRAELTSRLAQQ